MVLWIAGRRFIDNSMGRWKPGSQSTALRIPVVLSLRPWDERTCMCVVYVCVCVFSTTKSVSNTDIRQPLSCSQLNPAEHEAPRCPAKGAGASPAAALYAHIATGREELQEPCGSTQHADGERGVKGARRVRALCMCKARL